MFTTATEATVNEAYQILIWYMGGLAPVRVEETRNGKAKVLQGALVLTIREPRKRVLFDEERNSNPVFHLMEALWMIAGRNDVEFIRQFNKQMYTYSDDGTTFNAAYGYRWRKHFGYDQIATAVEMLKKNPKDRRVVISMWDPYEDLNGESLDLPCNQQIMPRVRNGCLDFLTTNRSNDLIWGLLGANCVHLTVLQEFMASALKLNVGQWGHISNNLHVYEHHWHLLKQYDKHNPRLPKLDYPAPSHMVHDWQRFQAECEDLCNGKEDYFEEPFFDETVAPMLQSWLAHKEGDKEEAVRLASCIGANDWRVATVAWYRRKYEHN